MPDQFTVPQFIDAEDKILGPITARQFIILLTAFLTDAVLYKLLRFVPFLIVAVPIICLAGVLAFMKVNGVGFHFFLLNLIQTFRKPKLRLWDKRLTDEEVRQYLIEKPAAAAVPLAHKAAVSSSRLHELTLVLNTGGVYKPEEES